MVNHLKGYRLSRFLVKEDFPDGSIIYNTATGSIIIIQNEDDYINSFDELVRMRFYVPDRFDEFEWVDGARGKYISSNTTPITSYTILPTTNCNARCFYCYEKGQRKLFMTEKTAKDVVDYILRNSFGRSLDLRWFGGEPLFNSKVIDLICNTLSSNNVAFKSRMISNGLLFTKTNILKAKNDWNLKSVQITLDGTRDVYQRAKSFIDSQGNEFDIVIDNIESLIDSDIHVSVRLNQDLYNTDDLMVLVDYLSLRFQKSDKIAIYNNLLFEGGRNIDDDTVTQRNVAFKKLQEKIIESGLYRNISLKKKIKVSHCMADNDSSVIILPNGDIGKCEHYTDKHTVGSIYSNNFDITEITRWKKLHQPTQKCFNCPLYPQCTRLIMCPVENTYCSYTNCENKIELIRMSLKDRYLKYKSSVINK